MNGDGFDDVIIGAYRNDEGGLDAGAAYVVYGTDSGLASINLAVIAGGTGGFKIIGEAAGDYAGYSVASAGDVNGDGFDDLIIGAVYDGSVGTGFAYVVFGAAGGLTTVDLTDIAAGTGGFKIIGEVSSDLAGISVSAAGDVDGDGFDDLIVGTSENDGGAFNAGAAYVIFGRDYTNQVKFLGVDSDDTLDGTGFDDILIGGRGNDTIDGKGGDDVIIGGAGSDTIVFDAADTLKVDGGTGIDILSVTGSGVTLDLTAVGDGLYEGFERIDLTGTGNNTLTLAVSDIYAITEGGNSLNGGTANTLIVDGSAGDKVDAGGGWTLVDSAVDIGGNPYTEYTQDAATLLVDNTVDQSGIQILVPAIDLADVAGGTGGFKIIGDDAGNYAGRSVSSAGDIDGDGFDDLIIGAPSGAAGATFVVFGAAGISSPIDLVDVANGTGGFKITGEIAVFGGDQAGYSVSSAGDVNGDGFADLIVGAPYNPAQSEGGGFGAAYVVFGTASSITAVNLTAIAAGTGGFKITGETTYGYDRAGVSVSSAGDVNGDGFDDLIVGAHKNDTGQPGNDYGAAYVVYGAASGITSINLDDVAGGTGGFKITGEYSGDYAGRSVSSAGDVNGDGFDDLIVGAPFNPVEIEGGGYGAAYVVFGAPSGITSIDLVDVADGTGGFKITGEASYDYAGISVSSAGDVNGDGFDDLIVGTYFDYEGRYDNVITTGAAYVVYGAASGLASINLVTIAGGTGGFKIIGKAAGDYGSVSVSSAGDVNGDGFDDLIIGVVSEEYSTGFAFVVFGAAGGFASVNLDAIAAGTGGFKINGEATDDLAGISVSSAGDIDGDGFDDLLVGASENGGGGSNSGAAYVIFGRDFETKINLDFLGDDADNVITGTGADEILIGGRGNDTLDGGAGDDVIIGGAGNDTIIFDPATDTLKVDGGTGTDILKVATPPPDFTLDLIAIDDGVYEGFERIDLGTFGGTDLILVVSDIYAITEGVNALTGTANTLIVDGNSGSTVDPGTGWTLVDDDVDIGGDPYTKYTQDAATLLVFNDLVIANHGFILAIVNGETITIDTTGFFNEGVITLANGGEVAMTVASADYTNNGIININDGGDLTITFSGTTPTFTNTVAGIINIENVTDTSSLILDGAGTFTNDGTINGSGGISQLNGAIFINNGSINAGTSPGTLTIDGDLFQGDDAEFNIELAGTGAGSEHDQIVVSGEIEWNGAINVTLLDGFEPVVGDSFTIVDAGSTSGELDHFHGLRFGDDMVLGTDFSDSGLTLTALQASPEHTGGAGNDVLSGGLGDNVMVGNGGDDIIVGGGGADHLYGDAGDDLLVVGGTDFARIDGGTGNDTLAFDGDLDLGLIRGDQIEGIEEIDITGSGDNLLTLDAEDIRAITDGVNTKADDAELHAENSLVITGNAGDTVDLNQFSDTGVDTSVGGRAGYSVYASTNGSAQVIVANEVAVV